MCMYMCMCAHMYYNSTFYLLVRNLPRPKGTGPVEAPAQLTTRLHMIDTSPVVITSCCACDVPMKGGEMIKRCLDTHLLASAASVFMQRGNCMVRCRR